MFEEIKESCFQGKITGTVVNQEYRNISLSLIDNKDRNKRGCC